MIDLEVVCGWRVAESVCVADSWHDGAHIMVLEYDLEPSA